MIERLMLRLMVLTLVTAAAAAQTPRPVRWMYGAPNSLDVVAQHQWLTDGTLAYWEISRDGAAAGIRKLDPATGKSTRLLDLRVAHAAIRAVDESAAKGAFFPDELSPNGRWALYRLAGDLFVVDTLVLRATRITETLVAERSARFSPDGRRLAFVRENDLWFHDFESKTTKRLTQTGSETLLNGTLSWVYWEEIFGRQDIGYWWSSDGSAIVFLETDESDVPIVRFLDFEASYPQLIEQRNPRVGDRNPSVRLGVLELDEDVEQAQKPTWLDLETIDVGKSDHEYVVRVDWMPGDRRLAIQTVSRSQKELHLQFLGRKGGDAKHVLTETDTLYVNVHDDLRFLEDGQHFLWVSERDGYSHLYRYTLDGKLVNRVTKGEFALRDPGTVFWMRQAVKGVDEETGVAYVSALREDSTQSQLYRVPLTGGELSRISEGEGTHKTSFRRDGAFYIDNYSSASRPPSVTLHRANGERTETLTAARTREAEKLDLIYPELTRVPARDGFAMPAFVYKPKNFDEKKRYPVVFHGYGGPSAPTVSDQWQGQDLYFTQLLLDRGFCVVSIDNRSATAESKLTENSIALQMYGDSELHDLEDGIRWLKKQSWVDGSRVGLWGWSGGGTLTLLGMTRTKEFRAGIAVAAVTSWRLYDTKWAESVMKRPGDNPDGYRHTDLVRRAKNLHGRLLLVHGTYDDNVHIQNAYAFADALIASGKIFDMMIYPMRKHGIADLPARLHLFRTMIDFWERNLK